MELMWNPGQTGLCLHIPEEFPITISAAPDDEAAAIVKPRHITLFRQASLKPILEPLGRAWSDGIINIPPIPPLRLAPNLYLAQRGPHPEKDPENCRIERKTWFVAVADQTLWSLWLDMFVAEMNEAMSGLKEPWTNPEPDRFFHVSIFNNRDGDPFRSIGDISTSDLSGG